MIKFIYFVRLLLILTLLTSCSHVLITEKDEVLFNKIDDLEKQITHEQWDQSLSVVNDFETSYQQRKWKLQLLGELDDYQDIELQIEKLKVSIREQEELEAKLGLKQIRYRVLNIFNL